MGRFVDLTGQKFGRLTVVERAQDYVSPKGNKNVQWLCKCSCKSDKYVVVNRSSLIGGFTKSCGCLHKEKSSENGRKNKKYNTYDVSGEYGIGFTSKREEFYFDLEDYNKIKDYCWYIDNKGYVIASDNKKGFVLLHRLIKDGEYIDHINHNTADNRKANIRNVTATQNQMNATMRIDNSSGVTGVSWHKKLCMWRSRINVNGKEIHLGYYNNFENAVKARKEAEEKYFGEFSYDNSMKAEVVNYG